MITNYELLSRDARIQLLGHYCSKMVTLMHADEMRQKEMKARQQLDGKTAILSSDSLPDDSAAIVAFLRRERSASAKEISMYAGVARSSMFRRLHELMEAGVIGKTGLGKQARYGVIEKQEATTNEAPNENRG
jgi:hypothetical protein